MDSYVAALVWLGILAVLMYLGIGMCSALSRWLYAPPKPPRDAVQRYDELVHLALRSDTPTEAQQDALVCAQMERQLGRPAHMWDV